MDDISLFELYLIRQGKRTQTVKTHICNIRKVIREVTPLTRENVDSYVLSLIKKGNQPSYINHILDAVALFGRFKKREELIGIKRIKESKESRTGIMSDEEIEAFINLPCPNSGERRKREWGKWSLFWSITAYSGMRPGEVAELEIDEVDIGANVYRLQAHKVKTNSKRNVPIAPNIKPKLEEYLKTLDQPYLFLSKRGGKNGKGTPVFDDAMWAYQFKLRLRLLNIKRSNLKPYSFRHSFGTRNAEEDMHIFKLKKIMGHKRIETTERYMHMTTKDVVEAIKKDRLVRKKITPTERINAIEEMLRSFQVDRDERFDYIKARNAINRLISELYQAIKPEYQQYQTHSI